MEIRKNDLNVSDKFKKVSGYLDQVKVDNESKLKIYLSDTQEVNMILDQYPKELKTKFKYNKIFCSPDNIKQFLLSDFPKAKISFFKLLKLGFISFPILFLFYSVFYNLLVFYIFKIIDWNINIVFNLIFGTILSLIFSICSLPPKVKLQ